MVVGNIPGLNTGKGGHYYSVKEIASELNQHFSIDVVVLGDAIPEALTGHPRLKWIECGQTPTPGVLKRIKNHLTEMKPDVIHCMDSSSLLFLRLANKSYRIPICWTKCGGRTLSYYTPRGAPDIVFHRDDLELYHSKGFKPLLIPNRFRIPQQATQPSPMSHNDSLRIVRISRICDKYKDGLDKTIQFYHAMRSRFPGTTLDIIGFPEDSGVLSHLRNLAGEGEQVQFLTDRDLTREASRHLPNYHIAVASGRSAMEAISYGLPTFITPLSSPGPVLASAKTIDAMMAANFSERAQVLETMEDAVTAIASLLTDRMAAQTYKEWTNDIYKNHISVEAAVDQYRSFYNNVIKQGYLESIFDLAKHFISFQSALLIRTAINYRRTRTS